MISRMQDWSKKAMANMGRYRRFLKRSRVSAILPKLPKLHEEAFARVDCLECAACCKNYSPRFKTPDIKRISKHMGLKEGAFIEKYLQIDDEGDYVLISKPCPFLQLPQNTCGIYDVRPSDCRRFPYTDEDVFLKRTSLTLKNASFCPAVFHVLEKLTDSDSK